MKEVQKSELGMRRLFGLIYDAPFDLSVSFFGGWECWVGSGGLFVVEVLN